MRISSMFSLGVAAAIVMGSLACSGQSGTPTGPAAALCATTHLSGGTEPASPQSSCATGPTTPAFVPQNWGVLNGTLCLTTGVPAAGLSGAQCTDPVDMEVTVTETGRQRYTTKLVQGTLTDPSTTDPFQTCTPASAGSIQVEPTQIEAEDSATFTITQTTAYFVSGQNAQLPPVCSVAITDGHNQQILVNVGIQIGVVCANASCTTSASVTQSPRRRRLRS